MPKAYKKEPCQICFKNSPGMNLACNHSFCRVCFQELEGRGEFRCPVCRKTWRAEVGAGIQQTPGPVGKAKKDKKLHVEILCSDHQKPVIFYCEKCKILCCLKCVPFSHKGHEMLDLEDNFDEIKAIERSKRSIVEKNLAEKKEHLLELLGNAQSKNNNVNKLIKELEKVSENINETIYTTTDFLYNLEITAANVADVNDFLSTGNPQQYASVVAKCEEILKNGSEVAAQSCLVEVPEGLLVDVANSYEVSGIVKTIIYFK